MNASTRSRFEMLQVLFAVIAAVRTHRGVLPTNLFERIGHRGEQFVLRARPVGLRFDDYLVLLVHRGHTGVALHHTFTGGHLGRLVVGAVR
jgi:hypothetical protein